MPPEAYVHSALEAISSAPGRLFRLKVSGHSMHPIIQNGEAVLVRPTPAGSLALGDLAVTQIDGNPTTHRLMDIQPGHLITMGDNRAACDPPTPENRLLGKVIAIESQGQTWNIDHDRWKPVHRLLALLARQTARAPRPFAPLPRGLFWAARRITRLLYQIFPH